MAWDQASANPFPSHAYLKSQLVGRSLIDDVPTPAVVLDLAKIRQNCELMLRTTKALEVGFRAHVKTHKCVEVARLQMGKESKDVRFIVSTLVEAEQLVPLLLEYRQKGASISVLYGVPVGLSQIERLSSLGKQLGPGSIAVMVDHPDQLTVVKSYKSTTGHPISVYVKTDTGYHRAGIEPSTSTISALVQAVLDLEAAQEVNLTGFYSHAGHSYGSNSPEDAMGILHQEILLCESAIQHLDFSSRTGRETLTISVGASPTAMSAQNLQSDTGAPWSPTATALHELIRSFPHKIQFQTVHLELHAGVYPFLDMQQLAANPRADVPLHPAPSIPIAITILAEVRSLYPRPQRPQPQALVNLGTLSLGREPCKSYRGWGVVTGWNVFDRLTSTYDPLDPRTRMVVSTVSQEHALVSYETDPPPPPSEAASPNSISLPLRYGQRVRVYPNHACVATAMYGYYLVVDSDAGPDGGEKIVDVWVRWRGW